MKKYYILIKLLFVLIIFLSSCARNNDLIYYYDKNAGFSLYIPKDWEIADSLQTDKYTMFAGPFENNFPSNIYISVLPYSGELSDYMDFSLSMLTDLFIVYEMFYSGDFKTKKGLRGAVSIIEGSLDETNDIRQITYYFPSKDGSKIIIIYCSTSLLNGKKYDELFEKCAKTFTWK